MIKMEELSSSSIAQKKRMKRGLLPGESLAEQLWGEDFKWTPPKPKYSINEIVKKAKKEGVSYGKYVALRHAKDIKL